MERSPSAVADVLRPILPSLSDEIMDAISREVEPYRRPLAGTFGRNVRTGVEVALTRFFSGDIEGGDRETYVELGRGEYHEGRSLDALLSAYRVGARIAWRRAHEAGDAAGIEPHALYELGEALFAYIDRISAESAEGWAEAQSVAEGERQRRRRRLVTLLASDPPADESAVRSAAEDAAWPLPPELAALVVGAHGDPDDGPDPVALSTRLGPDVIAAVIDTVVVAFIPDPSAPARRAQIERAVGSAPAALGPTGPWSQAGRSASRARLAYALAVGGVLPRDSLVVAGDHLSALVLHADAGLAAELAERELAPLRALAPGPQGKLVATLRAWLDHRGRVEEVAHALDVHPQTVRYRLGQLRELLGPRLEDPEARLALSLALRAQ